MAKTKRRTVIQAGRLVTAVVYTAALPQDKGQQRAAKLKASSEARQRINLKHSWQKLEQVVAANFDSDDLVATLTYDDEHLPPSRREAEKQLRKFLTQLRGARRKRGGDLKYIYVTEDKHGGGRIHHHVILSGTGSDYEEIRSLWEGGSAIKIERIDEYGYGELAKYLTKEPRETGSANGKRTWVPCKGLMHPRPVSDWVDDNLDLSKPADAILLEGGPQTIVNSYGSYTYIKYLLPKPVQRRCRPPRKTKTEKGLSFSALEHRISFQKE
jgi:hypothetical protein